MTPPAIVRRVIGPRSSQVGRLVEGRLARLLVPLLAVDLAVLAALGGLVWHEQRPDSLDDHVARAVYAAPGTAARRIFTVLTVAGAPGVVMGAAVAVGLLVAWRYRDRTLAAFVPATVVLAAGLETALKRVVARSRPSTAAIAHLTSHSFPSGHATAAFALACSIGLLVLATGHARRGWAVAALGAYAVSVAFSRLVLGVHYLTDVVAGAALALSVALVCGWLCSTSHDE